MNNLVEDLLDPAATGNASMEAFNRVMTQANLQSVDTDSLWCLPDDIFPMETMLCGKVTLSQVDEEKKVEAVSEFYKGAAEENKIANASAEWLLNAGRSTFHFLRWIKTLISVQQKVWRTWFSSSSWSPCLSSGILRLLLGLWAHHVHGRDTIADHLQCQL